MILTRLSTAQWTSYKTALPFTLLHHALGENTASHGLDRAYCVQSYCLNRLRARLPASEMAPRQNGPIAVELACSIARGGEQSSI